jgi:hypothetical protein
MTQFSDYAENLLCNFLLNNATATRPTAWFVALYTAAPSDSGGGTEVSTGGYSRQAVTFSVASAGATSNTGALTFTASASWGTITHIGIFDASTGGNLLMHGALTTPRTIGAGETLTFAIGDIDPSVD